MKHHPEQAQRVEPIGVLDAVGYFERLVAFSCKGRGVCPSCNAKRAHVTAVHLVERVLPHVPYRQWTLSSPHRVRWVLLKDAGLLSDVLTVFPRAVFALQRRRARRQGPRGGQPGAVSFIQFFGSALQVTPYFHSLVPDGVFVPQVGGVRFEPLPPPTQAEVERLLRVVRHRVLRLLFRRVAGVARDAALVGADRATVFLHCPETDQLWSLLAGGVAFYSLLALVPGLIAVVSIYALVADPREIGNQVTPFFSRRIGLNDGAVQPIKAPLVHLVHVQCRRSRAGIDLVDAMDLSYSKEHLDTFVILAGDSDFSPLVSKLKENNKYVIGIGVKNSSSNLLVDNCDEFIYYEDLERQEQDDDLGPAQSLI